MSATLERCALLAQSLDLAPVTPDTFMGKRRGFPLSLRCIDPEGNPLLLFQIRHPLVGDARTGATVAYEGAVGGLIADKRVEVEVEDRVAWLTLVEGASHLEDHSVGPILDSVLGSFEKAGFAAKPDLCHYCGRERVDQLIFQDGKVAQICPACLQERSATAAQQAVDATAGVAPMVFLGPFAAGVGAIGWTLVWLGYDKLFEFFHTNTLTVPRLLAAIATLIIGAIVGGPIGLVFKLISRKGQRLSTAMAIVFSVAGVVLGEWLYVACLTYQETHSFSPSLALRLLPRFWAANDVFALVLRLMAAGTGVGIAVSLARPPKPKTML